MNRAMIKPILLWCLLLSSLPLPLAVAAEATDSYDSRQPIEITARRLEAFEDRQVSIFIGDVVARQGDMTLHAERLEVYFTAADSGGQQVARLEASGAVQVEQGQRRATAERASYLRREGTLTLFDNAEVIQDGNRVAGDEIVLFIEENRSLVKSSGENRVRALIVPEQNEEQP